MRLPFSDTQLADLFFCAGVSLNIHSVKQVLCLQNDHANTQKNWNWIKTVLECAEVHRHNAADYHQVR